MKFFHLSSFAILIAATGCASTSSTPSNTAASAFDERILGPEIRLKNTTIASVYQFLSYQCGVNSPDRDFFVAVEQLPPDAENVFISTLRSGAPEEARVIAREQANARFERRQAWLEEEGEQLFGDETAEIADRNRADYVEDAMRRLDEQYRENSIRALGYIGGPEAVSAIEEATNNVSGFSPLAIQAMDRIKLRSDKLQ